MLHFAVIGYPRVAGLEKVLLAIGSTELEALVHLRGILSSVWGCSGCLVEINLVLLLERASSDGSCVLDLQILLLVRALHVVLIACHYRDGRELLVLVLVVSRCVIVGSCLVDRSGHLFSLILS